MMIKSGLGVAVAAIALVLFAIGAGRMALLLIRGNRDATISTLPVVPEQTVAITSPGELVVSFEVPRLTTDYREWKLEVREDSTQRIHRMEWGGPRATGAVTGISTIKIPVGRLTLAKPESLTLRMSGLAAGVSAEAHIILARPHLARMAVQIVGIVICGVGTLLSLIWGLWLLGVVKSS